MHKVRLTDIFEDELVEILRPLGVEKYRARQILEWVYARGAKDFGKMTNLPKTLREQLSQHLRFTNIRTMARQNSEQDGTLKFLFEFEDGHAVESVLLRHDYGNSVCVSTQVGCSRGCRFCASTLEGLIRNLSAGEIIEQVLALEAVLADEHQHVSSIVIMGAGEPLDNYDQVLRFIRLLHLPYGLNIGYRNITLSTCGVVPGIDRLAQEGLPITLSVSLHAPNDRLRSELMPINERYPIAELLAACDCYAAITKRRITYEYALVSQVNDRAEDARQLANLLAGRLCHVNLIPVNAVSEHSYHQPPTETIRRFQDILKLRGIEATIRKEMGSDIDAACGQLRRRIIKEKTEDIF